MDTTAWTTQLVQYSQVEQQLQGNQYLSQIASNSGANMSSAVNYHRQDRHGVVRYGHPGQRLGELELQSRRRDGQYDAQGPIPAIAMWSDRQRVYQTMACDTCSWTTIGLQPARTCTEAGNTATTGNYTGQCPISTSTDASLATESATRRRHNRRRQLGTSKATAPLTAPSATPKCLCPT